MTTKIFRNDSVLIRKRMKHLIYNFYCHSLVSTQQDEWSWGFSLPHRWNFLYESSHSTVQKDDMVSRAWVLVGLLQGSWSQQAQRSVIHRFAVSAFSLSKFSFLTVGRSPLRIQSYTMAELATSPFHGVERLGKLNSVITIAKLYISLWKYSLVPLSSSSGTHDSTVFVCWGWHNWCQKLFKMITSTTRVTQVHYPFSLFVSTNKYISRLKVAVNNIIFVEQWNSKGNCQHDFQAYFPWHWLKLMEV